MALPPVERRLDGVFEGGGVKGIGLVGALSVIEERGYEFVNLVGTSAGAVTATLAAAGYTAAELKKILTDLDFKTLTDTGPVGRVPWIGPLANILFKLGIYRGDRFLEIITDLLDKKGKRKFKHFVMEEFAGEERYRYKIQMIAADITRGRMLVLPGDLRQYGEDPDEFDVALAVRMSMSIPFFFRPVLLKDRTRGTKSLVVDGGLLSNFPVEILDSDGVPLWPTFGFRLTTKQEPHMVRHDIRGPVSELAALFFTAVEAHDARYAETANWVRTIGIDTLGIDGTKFELDAAEKESLYRSGVLSAAEFLDKWDFKEYIRLYRSGQPVPSRRDLALPPTPMPSPVP